jgi:hypothetical protein
MSIAEQGWRIQGAERYARHPLGRFSFGRYRFLLRVEQDLSLPQFVGATLRGGLGYVLKELVCTWPTGECDSCPHRYVCPYPYLFDTAPPPGSDRLRKLKEIPRPFVLETASIGKPQRAKAGENNDGEDEPECNRTCVPAGDFLECRLVLVGKAVLSLPFFIFAFERLGRVGLGRQRGRFRLWQVRADPPVSELTRSQSPNNAIKPFSRQLEIYSVQKHLCGTDLHTVFGRTLLEQVNLVPRRITVHFLSPTRICNDSTVCKQITFADLIRALLRRLSSLCYFHCGFELALDYHELIRQAGEIQTIASELTWQEQSRFSTRQRTKILMGGLVGHVTYEAPCVQAMLPFLPVLLLGQYVHVGKGTVMGMGKYTVRNADWYKLPANK